MRADTRESLASGPPVAAPRRKDRCNESAGNRSRRRISSRRPRGCDAGQAPAKPPKEQTNKINANAQAWLKILVSHMGSPDPRVRLSIRVGAGRDGRAVHRRRQSRASLRARRRRQGLHDAHRHLAQDQDRQGPRQEERPAVLRHRSRGGAGQPHVGADEEGAADPGEGLQGAPVAVGRVQGCRW